MLINQNNSNEGFINFELKFIKSLSIVSISISVVGAFFNLINGLGFNLVLIPLISAALFFLSYLWAKSNKATFWLKIVFTILPLFFINYLWYYNCNSLGPAPYFYIVVLSLLVFIWQGRQLIFVSLLLLANFILIFYIDYFYYPELYKISHYQTDTARIFDTYTTTLMYGVIIFVLVNQAKVNLQNEYRNAKHSDMLKSAFLANMSHEIRTPMNSIIGFSQLLKESNFSEDEKRHFIEIIRNQGEYLLALINNIIDISKIESGIITVNDEVVDIKELVKEIKNSEVNLKRHNVEFKIFIDKKIENNNILTDSTKLKQVLSNLVNNSLKFTLNGYVELGFHLLNNGFIEFYVKDTGIGIPKHEIDKIFERFYQMEINNVEILNSGTGLGLSISKALIEYLGGSIRAESLENVGSTFYVTIPYKPIKTKKIISEVTSNDKTENFNEHKVLIVEDVESNYFYLEQALTGMNIITEWCRNGQEAVKYIENNKPPDLILMDLKMPVMDGYTATKLIKNINPQIPIIAQSAYAFEHEHTKAIESGCDDYITKPIDIRILKDIFKKYLA